MNKKYLLCIILSMLILVWSMPSYMVHSAACGDEVTTDTTIPSQVIAPGQFNVTVDYPKIASVTPFAVTSGTFGNTNIGSSDDSAPNMYVVGGKYSSSASGTVTQISFYVRLDASGHVKVAIYSDASGKPNALLSQSNAVAVGTTFSWVNFTINQAVVGGTSYWLCWISDTSNCRFKESAGSANQEAYSHGITYPTFPSTFPSPSYNNAAPSIYANVSYVPVNPDFSISASPSTLTVAAGSSGSSTVTVTSLNGFTDTVSLSASAPSGWGATLTPSSITGGSGSSTLSITVPSSASSGAYTVTVTATSGSLSHSTTVTVNVQTAPSSPQNLGAAGGDSQVVLSWSAPSSNGGSAITNYKVYRGTSSGGETLLSTLGNVLTHTDTSVTNGQTYYYKVSAVNSVGESSLSTETSATPSAVYTSMGASYKIRINGQQHGYYGLGYPVTYVFGIPAGSGGLKAYVRHSVAESWSELTEKTSSDSFNGIECVRFDYTGHKAYISVAFSGASDNIYVRLTSADGNLVESSYLGIAEYYDNRKAAVVATADDWDGYSDRNDDFVAACDAFQSRSIWLTVGIVTEGVHGEYPPTPIPVVWANVQAQINGGYIEVASHSCTHDEPPYADYDFEIGDSKAYIIGNLTLPSVYTMGSSEFVWAWLEPSGLSDSTVRQKLGVYKYLIDRTYYDRGIIDWAGWDAANGLFDRVGITIEMGNENEQYQTHNVTVLNGWFDTAYAAGGIYHLMMHPHNVNWASGSYALQHLDYVKGKLDVWYVGFGALYAYHYVATVANISVEPCFTITVTHSAGGSIVPGTTTVDAGSTPSFTVTPDTGYHIIDVQVDGVSVLAQLINGVYTFPAINANHALDATFAQNDAYSLTVNVVGSGSVAKSPNQASYHYGDSVQLTATPSAGYTFSGWSDGLIGNPTYVTITGDTTITATFTQNSYTVSTSVDGSGSINLNHPGPYHYGDVVQLTAVPATGWSFDHWSQDLTGSSNPASLTITGNMAVTAYFTENTYTLTVNVVGTGCSVSLDNNGPYHYNDVVHLTANAAVGWTFSQWSGALTGNANPAALTITGNLNVTATFTQDEYTLTITVPSDGGSVSKSPDQATYTYGTTVTLTANANTGWTFGSWGSDATGTVSPTTITMTGSKSVTANFTQNTYTLAITSVGSGSVNLDKTGPYHYGDTVQLTAVPTTGWSFSVWSGDLSGSSNPTTILIDGYKGVTATFIQNAHTLTVNTVGRGSVVKVPDQASYHLGDVVQLTATPTDGWSFSSWSGALTGSANPAAVAITGDMSVTATFTQKTYTLTVTLVGSGSVDTDKSPPYYYGDVVQLTAFPSLGWSFSGWSGDLGGSASPTTITIDGNKAVTATFTRIVYTLTISTSGSGAVSTDKSAPYHYGDVVQLTATADVGWTFDHWSGDLTGSTNPASITMTGDKSVTTTFTQIEYTLTVSASPVEGGSVSRSPDKSTYHYGDVVQLTAVPAVGWSFQDWSGDISGPATPTTILVDGNKVVTATFTQNTYTLIVTVVGSGSVNRDNDGPYHYGDLVQFTAVPNIGWNFDYWSGDLTGYVNPTTLVINGNKSVTATFAQQCSVTFYTDPAGVDYNITFQAQNYLNDTTAAFPFGTSGPATASVPSGWVFDHWTSTGNVSVSNTTANPTTVTITSAGTLKAVYAPAMDFSITKSPASRSIAAGSAPTFTITASLLHGAAQSVSFSCSGLPLGATSSFSPASGLPTFSSTLKITTTTSTPPGIYTITVTGTSQYASNWTTLQLKIMNFSVAPTPFSPNGDGIKDTTTVESTFWGSLVWTLTVKNSLGSIVRQLGTGTASSISIVWDGRNDAGAIVADGTYTVSLVLPGLTKTRSVVVDTILPTLACSWSRSPFNPRSRQTSKLSCTLSEKCSVYIQIYDSAGSLVRTLLAPTTKSKGTFSVTWDGKDDSGVIVPSGTYTCKIFAEDTPGNRVSPYPTTCQIVVS